MTKKVGALALVCLGLLGGCGDVNVSPDGPTGDGPPPSDRLPPDTGGGDTLLCQPDSTSCGADMNLYQCSSDGTMLTKVQDCQFGCTGDHCKQCDSAVPMFCNGENLSTCDANGMISGTTPCTFGCQMNRCNTCMPGAQFCQGSTAVTCGANGMPSAMMNCGANGCMGGVCNMCTASTTTCQGDTLVVCNAAGMIASTTNCALGCTTTPTTRCRNLVPSYGVGTPMGALTDLTANAASTLDISACPTVMLTVGAMTTSVTGASVVNQTGAAPICVVRFNNISIESGQVLTITNSATTGQTLSLQALGTFDIQGRISFRNNGAGLAPGGSTTAPAVASGVHHAPGGGGAGNAIAGGAGGACVGTGCASSTVPGGAGGAAVTTITTRLTAGSQGGGVSSGGSALGIGGLGGGGLQLVALTSITVGATGVIDVNGNGGYGLRSDNPAGGAGSGGSLVVEAPSVTVSAGAIIAANGGGGSGGCYRCLGPPFPICFHNGGASGALGATRAAGGTCTSGGNGGWEANGETSPSIIGQNSDTGGASCGGGGGGSKGFIFLRARGPARLMINSSAVVSPAPTTGNVTTN